MPKRDVASRLKRGSSLVLAALIVVILLVVGGGLLSLGLQGQLFAIRTGSDIMARSAADAGLAAALSRMNRMLETRTWSRSELTASTVSGPLPNSSATFTYNITATGASLKKPEFTITSVGSAGQTRHTVTAVVGLKGLFDSAILVQQRISLMPGSIVDGFNSADPTDSDADLKIGTLSTVADSIPIGPGTVINGDVFVGVGGDPGTVIGAGGTITGRKYALIVEPEQPVISVPPLPDTGTELAAKGATVTLTPAQSGTYTGITLAQAGGSAGILEITGGKVALHITGNIDMGQGCELVIEPGSSLVLYVDGDIYADNSGGLNNQAGNVRDFQIYGTGDGEQVFDLKAKSKIFGTIYAPNADITVYPNGDIAGAIVGRNVTFKSGCTFYYDEALRDVTIEDEGVRFVVKRWQE